MKNVELSSEVISATTPAVVKPRYFDGVDVINYELAVLKLLTVTAVVQFC